uniref:Uncharacterized protein n=1 Tax=Anguilla anguilla TaxID=7936 RepID=A0A0E9V0Y3_ANGAN
MAVLCSEAYMHHRMYSCGKCQLRH